MPIPLYFALSEKDSVRRPKFRAAQCGFGFAPDGSLRLPREIHPKSLTVVDDAVLPRTISSDAIARLADLCQNGCVFDFERQPQKIHTEIIQKLQARLPVTARLAAPVQYAMPRILPLIPQPSDQMRWEEFLRNVQKKHPDGWMLEVIPCERTITLPFARNQGGYLPDAVCNYQQNGKQVHYFDTRQTVRKKLEIAERYGCRAAIGLYGELMALANNVIPSAARDLL